MVGAEVIAVAALVRGGRVLMVHRHPARRWYPDCWDLPGGHVERGETPQDAAVRECREELGVDVVGPRSMPFTTVDPSIEMHAFAVVRWNGEPANLAPEEHDRLGWFDAADLERLTLAHPTSRADLAQLVLGNTLLSSPMYWDPRRPNQG